MGKDEFIKRYGEDAYEKMLKQTRDWQKVHREQIKTYNKTYREAHRVEVKTTMKKTPEQVNAYNRKYRKDNPEKVKIDHQEACRKGGRRYNKNLEYKRNGIQGEKNSTRTIHAKQYKPYKAIIAPDSQLHHEWIQKTAEYRGVALVEADAHRYGIIDVIQILNGKITLLTEEEVKRGKGCK
jgi:cellobiose-specific phosphotransferase system component IIB